MIGLRLAGFCALNFLFLFLMSVTKLRQTLIVFDVHTPMA